MNVRALGVITASLGCSFVSATQMIVRVGPDTIPAHLDVSITAIECAPSNAASAPWYATVSSELADVEGKVSITIILRDPETNEFLFNPGARAAVEGQRVPYRSRLLREF